jgi:hypothetical protein
MAAALDIFGRTGEPLRGSQDIDFGVADEKVTWELQHMLTRLVHAILSRPDRQLHDEREQPV